LRDTKRDVPAARMAHQVDRLRLDLFDEGDDIIDMLRHLVIVAAAVPMLREEMPQAERDDAVLPRQRSEHGIPGAEVAERAVHADQRMAPIAFLPNLQIGHIVAVDAQGLHERLAESCGTTCAGLPETGWIATISKPTYPGRTQHGATNGADHDQPELCPVRH